MKTGAQSAQQAAPYETVADVIRTIVANPELAFMPKHALRSPLAGVFRIKKGRFRLFFIASREKQAAIVLFLGYRKEGDKRDAYSEFERHLRRGAFDPQFVELGMKRPET
jgi:hypothetical protein